MKATIIVLIALAAVPAFLTACGGSDSGPTVGAQTSNTAASTAIPLKEAKLNIEHNATDNDTGFQGAIDSEGWS